MWTPSERTHIGRAHEFRARMIDRMHSALLARSIVHDDTPLVCIHVPAAFRSCVEVTAPFSGGSVSCAQWADASSSLLGAAQARMLQRT
jgi:hypothetical protein